MLILFISVLLLFGILYLLSRNKFKEYKEPLDKKEYKLKEIINVGFLLMELSGYGYISAYDRRLLMKLSELKGVKYSHYYLRVLWAEKISFVFFMAVIMSFLAAASGEPDGGFLLFSLMVLGLSFYFPDWELSKKG